MDILEIKDQETGKEYKFEHLSNGIELLSVGINYVGDKVIYGTVAKCGKIYHAEWELNGELYRSHNDLEQHCLSMTQIAEPKPCPFCGSEDLALRQTSIYGNWYIDCNCCKVFVNKYMEEKKDAVLKWNRRSL